MPHEVIMPALGMAQDTGLIVAWHKSPGDAVAADDVLFEVETDKATMEVPAGADGFVTKIRAHAGSEVPVGDVIALIGDTREAVPADEKPAGEAAPVAADLPEGNNVIMPALGMAQDTGVIVAWHKSPGDAVAAGDILFEVETDKSTVEVEAGFDGFVAALLAEAGEEAPVGETIAVITAAKPEKPVQASRASAPAAVPASASKASASAAEPSEIKLAKTAPKAAAPGAAGGRILASPKARRIALEQGLDLNRLAEAGHPQPYHVADLEALKSLPAEAPQTYQSASRRLMAALPSDGFDDFAAWAAEAGGLKDSGALLAGFAGASLGRDATVAVEVFGATRVFAVPMGSFAAITVADPDAIPDLLLRDLRMSRISTVALGAEDAPTLTLTQAGEGLAITLECASNHLTAAQALSVLSNFAGRMEQPLRHLL